MFFLAFVVMASLGHEAPKIVSVHRTLEDCMVASAGKNKAGIGTGPNETPNPLRYFCLKAIPDA
jgi:hypothetical protein